MSHAVVDVADAAADGPGLDTDALLTWPLPPAPVDAPRVNSDTLIGKLCVGVFVCLLGPSGRSALRWVLVERFSEFRNETRNEVEGHIESKVQQANIKNSDSVVSLFVCLLVVDVVVQSGGKVG